MSNKKFDINKIDNLLAEQRNVEGLLTLLSDTLQSTLDQINDYEYDDAGKVPHDVRTGVIVQLLRDRNSLFALLTCLEKANQSSIEVLNQQVEGYYHELSKGDQEE